VSDVRVEQKQVLSREEAARFLSTLADGLADGGKVAVPLGNSSLELSVADQLRWELEVAVDGDGIELELELKWSTSGRASVASTEESAGDEADNAEVHDAEVDDAEVDKAEVNDAEVDKAEVNDAEGALTEDQLEEEGEPLRDASSPEEATSMGGESVEVAGGETEAEQEAEPDQPAESSGRRRRSARAAKSAANGVDTAAVRAWATANGLPVSPRGRIRDEVLEAYRAAGN
jgi:amphi-Trp domain-containing protein